MSAAENSEDPSVRLWKATKAEAVRTVGREIEALAQRAIGQTITFAEFEDLHVRLMDLGFALMPHHALGVASAIMDPAA